MINYKKYLPPLIFRLSHINTVYPSLYRKVDNPYYKRETIDTDDGDFIDLDTKFQASQRLAILCHGLEGSSQSKYMIATANMLFDQGWDVIAMNYRGCSGQINNGTKLYHAGKTDDLHSVVTNYMETYDSISIIGFSLGGNVVLKYGSDGHYTLDSRIKSIVSVSSPLDLTGSGVEIEKWKNRLYNRKFVKELKEKIKQKAVQYPDVFDLNKLKEIKTLFDFDDQFTAPVHGFGNAANYYKINSAIQFLENIKIPTLIIQAKDDSFLSPSSYPIEAAKSNKYITLLTPKYGGHLGFYLPKSKYYWDELMIGQYLFEKSDNDD